MKFADPLKVSCPRCGGGTFHSVASLRALQAERPLCQASLRDAGEEMNAFVKRVENGFIAMGITKAIEELDSRVRFGDDFDYEDLACLNDVIALTDKVIAGLPSTDRPGSGTELVEAVIKEALPSVDCPAKHLPLVDAFAGYHQQMDEWFWGGRKLRPSYQPRS